MALENTLEYNINDKLFSSILMNSLIQFNEIKAPVAQLDRAFGYGPEGSGFKS